MGVSSVSGPAPNKGYEAAVIQRMGGMINQMQEMIPMVGATSELGLILMDTLKKFAKHVPPGAASPASEKNDLQRRMMQNAQNSQMVNQMRGGMGQQQPPQGQGGPPQMAPRPAAAA